MNTLIYIEKLYVMIAVSTLSANLLAIIFLACAGIIAFAGTKMAKTAEEIAVQTGLGQAIVGAIFVGVSTSLSGTILSFYTAFENHPSLSVSNSIGGIAAQTAFLALADLTYRRANLEHAAASLENLAQGALLIILLSIPLLATVLPEWTAFSIHPFSPLLFLVYLAGVRIVRTIRSDPMWSPKKTAEMQTEPDKAFPDPKKLHGLLTKFSILVLILAATGLILGKTGVEIASRTGLSETVIGGLFTSVTTSLPELITMLAAVRRGALNLAVGNIIGGNSFDVLFLAGSDFFYREGSIFHSIDQGHILLITMGILMNSVIMLGMIKREKIGPAGIGFESVAILFLYFLMVVSIVLF